MLERGISRKFSPKIPVTVSPMRRAMRASVLGLVVGMLVGAVVLGVLAGQKLSKGCEGLSPEECNLERQIAISLARQEALGALGLTLVAGGLAIALRRR